MAIRLGVATVGVTGFAWLTSPFAAMVPVCLCGLVVLKSYFGQKKTGADKGDNYHHIY